MTQPVHQFINEGFQEGGRGKWTWQMRKDLHSHKTHIEYNSAAGRVAGVTSTGSSCWSFETTTGLCKGDRKPPLPSHPQQDKLVEDTYSPVMVTKAVKNSKEQALLKDTHVCSWARTCDTCGAPGLRLREGSPLEEPVDTHRETKG